MIEGATQVAETTEIGNRIDRMIEINIGATTSEETGQIVEIITL